jgi:hypothetical protein
MLLQIKPTFAEHPEPLANDASPPPSRRRWGGRYAVDQRAAQILDRTSRRPCRRASRRHVIRVIESSTPPSTPGSPRSRSRPPGLSVNDRHPRNDLMQSPRNARASVASCPTGFPNTTHITTTVSAANTTPTPPPRHRPPSAPPAPASSIGPSSNTSSIPLGRTSNSAQILRRSSRAARTETKNQSHGSRRALGEGRGCRLGSV